MPEKMHLFGLTSPIVHRAKVKEVKDRSIEYIYSSLLLSLTSPPYPCATRFGAFYLRIYARGGERGKEVPIDAPGPAAAHLSTVDRCARTPSAQGAPRSARFDDRARGHTTLRPALARRHVATSNAGRKAAIANGSFPRSYAEDRDGNGREDSFCLLRIANIEMGAMACSSIA